MMHIPLEEDRWGDEWRSGVAVFTHVHHIFLPRATHALAGMWRRATLVSPKDLSRTLLFFVEQAIWSMSLLNRYRPTGYSQVNQYMSGRIRIFSQHAECSPWYILEGKAARMASAFGAFRANRGYSITSTGDCSCCSVPSNSIDYVFTDPPFGENFFYSDLNFMIEAWHRVLTDNRTEAIVIDFRAKRSNNIKIS